jgi:hypothetical protein
MPDSALNNNIMFTCEPDLQRKVSMFLWNSQICNQMMVLNLEYDSSYLLLIYVKLCTRSLSLFVSSSTHDCYKMRNKHTDF